MGLVCIQNSSLLVYSKSQKVSASYCLPFQHSRGKNQPVGGFRPPPGLFRVKKEDQNGLSLHRLTAFFKMIETTERRIAQKEKNINSAFTIENGI